MTNLQNLVIISLAIWRLSNMLKDQAGPWNVFGFLRRVLINPAKVDVEGSFSQGASCLYCFSVWLSFAAFGAYLVYPVTTTLCAIPLAMAAVVAILQRWTYDAAVSIESESQSPPTDADMLEG